MPLPHLLLLSMVFARAIAHDAPCSAFPIPKKMIDHYEHRPGVKEAHSSQSNAFPVPPPMAVCSTQVPSLETSCRKIDPAKQFVSKKRVIKRQADQDANQEAVPANLDSANNEIASPATNLEAGPTAPTNLGPANNQQTDVANNQEAAPADLGGCSNEQLSQIMQHVAGPLLADKRLRLGDVAQILQQSVQRATGKSFEITMGKNDMQTKSHLMSGSASCKLQIGDYYTSVHETPVQYNINDVQREQEMSNIDFGERLGGSGYPGQQPFPVRVYTPFDNLLARPISIRRECFSGDLIVETIEGSKRMGELRTGDEVLSMEGSVISFSPIIMFLHRDEELMAEFNVITTANGDSVKLTNEHFIYVSDCVHTSSLRIVRAEEVTTNHCLIAVRSQLRTPAIDRVTNVTKMHERGIYSPLTSTGDIIVNGVLSSCHSNLVARTLQQSIFNIYRSFSFILPEEGPLPLGLEFLISALDLFFPVK